jgi:hypothetical protein
MTILFVAAFLTAISAWFINKGKRWYGPTPCKATYIDNKQGKLVPYALVIAAQPLDDRYPKNSIYQPVEFYNASVTYNGTESCWMKTQGSKRPATLSLVPQTSPDFKKRSNDTLWVALWLTIGGVAMAVYVAYDEGVCKRKPPQGLPTTFIVPPSVRQKRIREETVKVMDENKKKVKFIAATSSDPPSVNSVNSVSSTDAIEIV